MNCCDIHKRFLCSLETNSSREALKWASSTHGRGLRLLLEWCADKRPNADVATIAAKNAPSRSESRPGRPYRLHPAVGFVSSIRFFNLSSVLENKDSDIEFDDSRARVVAMIEFIKRELGASFPKNEEDIIPDAVLIVEGEPT